MKNKISTKNDFKEFQDFMLDESVDAQKKRIALYENNGGLSPQCKAKFIIEKTGPYIYALVSKIEEISEETSNSDTIEDLQSCFSGIKKMLKAKEQVNAFENEFKSLNFEKRFQDLEKILANHKKDIFKFTNTIFSSIINDLSHDSPPDLLALKDIITSEEIYDYVVSKNSKDSLSQEDYTIGKMLIRALDREKASVNTEVIGRVYAYVKSGWAKSDLYDKEGINENNSIKELNTVIDYIKKNPLGKTPQEKEVSDSKLAEAFSKRLNEISITIIYNREKQNCLAKSGNIEAARFAQSGTADMAISYKHDPSTLIQVYCTSNPALYYTEHGSKSNSLLSHQIINNRFLLGKSIADISQDDRLKNNLIDTYYNSPIKNIEVINIAPGMLSNKNIRKEYLDIFKKKSLSIKEISTINQFPLIYTVLKYIPDNKQGQTITINEILNIKENIVLNDRDSSNAWENLSMQIMHYAHTEEKKEEYFYNRFLIPYVEDVWNIIKNKDLKDDFVITNNSEATNYGAATYFIKELPHLLKLITHKINYDKNNNIFNKKSLEIFINILEEITTHSNFISSQSSNTIGLVMEDLDLYKEIFKRRLEQNLNNESKDSLISNLKRKV